MSLQFNCYISLLTFLALCLQIPAPAQVWHNKERILHYKPSGTDFVLQQGTKKFNRALYGTNTGFRVEAGDLPEFALYMPGMGGNCKVGLLINGKSKWITEASSIKTTYRPGSMIYEIKDLLLQNGSVKITSLAMADAEGFILKIETTNTPANLSVVIAYGGATGKKFSREGDIGADPESSFYMQPAYCKNNIFTISKNHFQLNYGFTKPLSDDERYEIQQNGIVPDTTIKDQPKQLKGTFPQNAVVQLADAEKQLTPLTLMSSSSKSSTPVIIAQIRTKTNDNLFFFVENNTRTRAYAEAPVIFKKATDARKQLTERIVVATPDEYINPLGGALAIAADGIWEAPTFLHGAVAWRMRLPAWRGAYAADALGWQDRARLHFDSYLKSQVTNIHPGNAEPDTALHFTRQKERMGNAMFSNGYICRYPDGKIQPHHYDMNLVFIDQLLTHLKYTGDIGYIKKVWPSIKLHLQWEKRNFDVDGDGLYDAYACIWASDALQYSGGGVTHSSSYNYRANRMAAQLALMIGEDASPYKNEADKIQAAMNQKLWSADIGSFAEYKDLHGNQLLHTSPGLWTIYHAIDGETATPQQQFQMLRYIDHHIPHIPVKAKGLPFDDLYLLSTTNWQPYTWSVNNVALAENLHTALAYWQSGESENAFKLWKSALVESMYLGSSPGNFQQLSFYDAVRGELYRDFADPIGVAARTLTEGLFGILPDALTGTLSIKPSFPSHWKFAKLKTPNVDFSFKEEQYNSYYTIRQSYPKQMRLKLRINAIKDGISAVYINGKKAGFTWIQDALHRAAIELNADAQEHYEIRVIWQGQVFAQIPKQLKTTAGEDLEYKIGNAKILDIADPQAAFTSLSKQNNSLSFTSAKTGVHPLFITLKQNEASWIQPLSVRIHSPIEIVPISNKTNSKLTITNLSSGTKTGTLIVNDFKESITIGSNKSQQISIPLAYLSKGTNTVNIHWQDGSIRSSKIQNWNAAANGNYEAVNIASAFNENVTNTFKNQYLFPRPNTTALQIPWQGIGNWCYPLIQPEISEEGINNQQLLQLGQIPFALGSQKNIAYTSQWSNFPESITIPLSGKAKHAYLLMAGTTNHQQSQMMNGVVYINYTDGSKDSLALINPENWWPIDQDYLNDGFAFKSGERPYRLIFKTGTFTQSFNNYSSIKGFTNNAIEGGAGTVLDLPLNKAKALKSLTLKTITNEVLIGLMGVTLQRN